MKRFWCFLLVFCMLVSVVPAVGVAASETADGKTAQKLESFYDLYTTDGLVAFFDAFGTADTVDIANGKWYAKKYDADTGSWTKDEQQFATITGGAYDKDATPTGWQKGENGGFGYADPTFAASGNNLSFDASLLASSTFTVEATFKFTMRDVPGETEGANGPGMDTMSTFVFGNLYGMMWTNLKGQNSYGQGKGLIRWYYARGNWQEIGYTCADSPWKGWVDEANTKNANNVTSVWTVTKLTDKATGGRTYKLSVNGTVSLSKSDEGINPLPENATARFQILNGLSGTVYALRVYDRTLTEREALLNKAADLFLKTGFDVEKFNALDASGQEKLLELVAGMSLDSTLEQVNKTYDDLGKLIAEIAAATKKTAYDEMYVGADGSVTANGGHLTVLLSAYDKDLVSVSFDRGMWFNKMGDAHATIAGGLYNAESNATGWKKLTTGGIGYDTASENSNAITLPISALPDGSYTVEMVGAVRGYTVDGKGETLVSAGQYGASSTYANFVFGPLQEWLYSGNTTASNKNYTLNKLLDIYKDGTVTWGNSGYGWKHNLVYTKNGDVDFSIISYAVSLSVADGSTYSFYKNATLDRQRTYATTIAKNDSQSFKLFAYTGSTALAVRVYDANLTTSELAYNRFIDMAAYAGLDLANFKEMSADLQMSLAQQMASATFSNDPSAMKAAVDKALEEYRELEAIKRQVVSTVYDDMYVGADGSETVNGGKLVALFTDYGTDVSAWLKGGMWLPKKGDYTATINGGQYNAETNKTGWVDLANGGIGYSDDGFGAGSNSITLDSAMLNGNYTVELIQRLNFRNIPREQQVVEGADLVATDGAYKVALETSWNWGGTAYITFSGEPGTVFTPEIYVGNTVDTATEVRDCGAQTIGEDGTVTVSVSVLRKRGLKVVELPGVTVTRIAADKYTSKNEANSYTGYAFGPMTAMMWTNKSGSNTWGNGFGNVRWNYGSSPWNVTNGSSGCSWWTGEDVAVAYDGTMHNMVVTRTVEENGDQTYSVSYGSSSAVKVTITNNKTYKVDAFTLLNNIPAEVYAIRVYDAPLTKSEINHNRFVDLMAYAGVDPTSFLALSADLRATVIDLMGATDFTADKEALNARINAAINLVATPMDEDDYGLYVTNGLKVLLTAYNGLSTGMLTSSTATLWANAMKPGEYGTLTGNWARQAAGGMRIDLTLPDGMTNGSEASSYFSQNNNFGLELDYSMLPEESYTVEVVTNPVGITTRNDKGELERFVDQHTTYGIFDDYGFVLGPLRCMYFACYRPAGNDGQMEKRWVYLSSGCWNASGYSARMGDTTFKNLGMDEILIFTIQHAYDSKEGSKYSLYKNSALAGSFSVQAEVVISKADTQDQRFQLLHGLANTMYAVRVYDRALSTAELQQNRVADLFYYFGLDTSMLLSALDGANSEMKATVFDAFSALDFTMTKQEAEAVVASCMAGIWVSSDGVGVRTDGKDALRFYFNINQDTVATLMAAGYDVEIGALLNIGTAVSPTLSAYNYRFLAMDSVSGMYAAYMVDNDTFAFTLNFDDTEAYLATRQLSVAPYIRYVDNDNVEHVYYGALPYDASYAKVTTLFSVYKAASESDIIAAIEDGTWSDYFAEVCTYAYTDRILFVDDDATVAGDGTENKPFASLSDAFAKAKHLLAELDVPTNVQIYLQGGTYPVTEPLTYDGDDVSYLYFSFGIYGSLDEPANITTSLPLDNSQFVTSDDDIYTYQFAPDADGNYPTFRNLYINGESAVLAHAGDTSKYNGNPYLTRFAYTTDGLYEMAELAATQEVSYLIEWHKNTDPDKAALAADVITSAQVLYPDRPSLQAAYDLHHNSLLAVHEVIALFEAGLLSASVSTAVPAPAADAADAVKANYNAYVDCFCAFRDEVVASQQAFTEIIDLYEAGNFTSTSASTSTNDKVKSYFARYSTVLRGNNNKTAYAAIKELKDSGRLTASSTAPKFPLASDESNKSDETTFVAAFDALRDLFLANKTGKIVTAAGAYEEISYSFTSTAKADGKFYVNYDMVESLEDYVRQKAAQLIASGRTEDVIYKTILQDGQLEAHIAAQWNFNIVHIIGIDFDDYIEYTNRNTGDTEMHVAIYFNLDEYSHYQVPGGYATANRYISLQNALQFVDEDGEYYYDVATGLLTLKAEGGLDGLEIRYPTQDNLFIFEDARNIIFQDVTIWGVDDYATSIAAHLGSQAGSNNTSIEEYHGFTTRAGIFVTNCDNFSVEYTIMHDIGGDGISLRGRVENLTLNENEIYSIGTSAIRIGDNTNAWDAFNGNENVAVTNNYLHDIATVIHQAPAFQMQSTKDAVVSNNTIIGCSYSAMSIGWRWNTVGWKFGDGVNLTNVDISYNYITDFMTELADGGAIYMLGGNAEISYKEYFNFLHHNYIVFSRYCGDGLGGMQCGIYFDGSCTNWLASQNVVVEQSAGADRGSKVGASQEDKELLRRRNGSTFMYTQHIDSQLTYNIKYQDNYIFNVRSVTNSLDPKVWQREVYRSYIVASRNIVEEGTIYYSAQDLASIPSAIRDIIYSTGSPMMTGDDSWLVDNEY